MSNYSLEELPETGVVNDSEAVEYRPCKRCRGSGWVWLHDQETDCLDCFGDGEVPIPL